MHHVLQVVVVGDRDQGVEVFAGELVLERHVGFGEGGELGDESGELGAAIDGEDLGLAADVAELVVVRAGEDLAAIAAHELDFVVLGLRISLVDVPWRRVLEIDLAGARGRVAGFRVGAIGVVLHGYDDESLRERVVYWICESMMRRRRRKREQRGRSARTKEFHRALHLSDQIGLFVPTEIRALYIFSDLSTKIRFLRFEFEIETDR